MKRVPVFDEVRRYVAGIDLAGAADHYVCGPRNDDGSHDVDIGEKQYEERRRERTLKSMKSKIQKLSISAEELGFLELAG